MRVQFKKQPCSTCGAPRKVVDGAWLRRQRERAGLSLRQFAKALDLSAPYISDIELNRRGCSARILAAYESLSEGA